MREAMRAIVRWDASGMGRGSGEGEGESEL